MAHGTLVVPYGTFSGELSMISQLLLFLFVILFINWGSLSGKRTNVPDLLVVLPWAITTILTMGCLFSTPWDTG